MFKKIFRQISRPLQYVAKTGRSETHQTGRNNIGGQITNAFSTIKLKNLDTTLNTNFQNHLKSKGVPNEAINYFSCLKFVKCGHREQKDFILNRSTAKLERIGVAVQKIDQDKMKIAIIWDVFTVTFQEPQILIKQVTHHYGPGWRNSNDHSRAIGRGLTSNEETSIKNRLEQLANSTNSGLQAKNMLN